MFSKSCASVAAFVSSVLTKSYRSATRAGAGVEMVVRCAPLHQSKNIIDAHASGLLPTEMARTLLMGSQFGASKAEIEEANRMAAEEARQAQQGQQGEGKSGKPGKPEEEVGDAPESVAGEA